MKSIRNTLVLLLLFINSAFAQEPSIDVQHYSFHLNLSDESNDISGMAGITVQFNANDVSSFQLDLIGKSGTLAQTGMIISSITEGKKATQFTHKNSHISIEVSPPAMAGETRTFEISYAGVPADGLFISSNKYGQRTFFGDNWPNRARHWLPTVDHPSDKATVEFIVTAPSHYQVIANGLMVEESDLLNGTRRTHWRSDIPLATKVTVMGAAQFAIQYAGEFNNIPIQHWVYPQDREAGFYDFGVTNDIMAFFEGNIGPYPYEKLANVQSKTRYGGMENASNIFYSETAITGDRKSEGLVAHEIAHQWFGNSATEADWQHIWLSEGFASYFTQLYMEHAYGRERLVDGMQKARISVLDFYRRKPNAPLVNPEITDPNDHLNTNSYQKGAWLLHMLRHKIGDTAFWKGIQAYYARYRDKNATSENFKKEMETASGVDLDLFFNQWLYKPGQPILEHNWSYNATQQKIFISIKQIQKPLFDVPLEIAILMHDGSRKMETVRLKDKALSLEIDASVKPASIILDPDTWLLARLFENE